MTRSDAIAAIATPVGEGGISVIRISGAAAVRIAASVFKGTDLRSVPSHTVHFGRILRAGEVVDEVLATVFRAPRSYTGEDTVEISCHGGVLVTQLVLETVLAAGARPAEPGEFTQRAFLNGKLELSQAEAVADLIHARSRLAVKAAGQQLEGDLGAMVRDFRQRIIDMTALIELELDFVEEDVEFANRGQLIALIEDLVARIDALLATYEAGRLIKDGVRTVIAGRPNAGKSTLLNALMGKDRAIVSPVAGTTRDVIEAEWSHEGVRFILTDTAGLRDTADAIEAEGVRRSENAMAAADLIVLLHDVTQEAGPDEDSLWAGIRTRHADAAFLLVGNKADLAPATDLSRFDCVVSAASGAQLTHLMDAMKRAALGNRNLDAGGLLITTSRHRDALAKTRHHLESVLDAVRAGKAGDFTAIDLRAALHELGTLTGQITTEDLLDSIFSRFCIGK